jgi:hypothetical protein
MDQLIPVSNLPNQALTVALSIDSTVKTLQLTFIWNKAAGYWVMSVADALGNPLLSSIPLVCGYYPAANVLQQYAYLGIGSAYVLNSSGTNQDIPDSTTLGSDFLLLWSDTPVIGAALPAAA